jgi:HAD superfamily hydrolase (TIGR01549 family)
MHALLARRHWIFDLDGTLTVAVHDFDALRKDLGMPRGAPILETLAALPWEQAGPLHDRVEAWEVELAAGAEAEADAVALLEYLAAQDHRLALLTRNTRATADRTLEVTGLARFFSPHLRLGRGDAAPKPSPEGVQRILKEWGATPDDAVMVGDYRFDLIAGREAGVATVWIDRDGKNDFSDLADATVQRLDQLL